MESDDGVNVAAQWEARGICLLIHALPNIFTDDFMLLKINFMLKSQQMLDITNIN